VQDGAIQYRQIDNMDELPVGVEVEQAPGLYRLEQGNNNRIFNYSNGPQGLKPLVFAPHEVLWQAYRNASGELVFSGTELKNDPTAVIGVRACDLAALELQDRHFLGKGMPDPQYKQRRDSLLLIGVDCNSPSATCFCASTGDGPALQSGFDIGMSELEDGFLLRAGSSRGRELLRQLDLAPAIDEQLESVAAAMAQAAAGQQRKLPGVDLQKKLFERLDPAYWQQVASRCLACCNCSAVCPTCFCFSEHAETQLDGASSQQVREWDSCFTPGHSAVHGFQVRADTAARYRQWLTHKLAGWHEQYGRSGCVGCGRCITWCPVGIDITQEVSGVVADDK